jgi:hypothetical protein
MERVTLAGGIVMPVAKEHEKAKAGTGSAARVARSTTARAARKTTRSREQSG